MRTTTKILFLTLSLFLISNFAFSQDGVYKTYQDYVNRNLTDYGTYVGFKSNHVGNKFRLLFEKNGETKEVRIETANIWGYKNNEGDYRISGKYLPCKILIIGKLTLYGDHSRSGQVIVQTSNMDGSRTMTHYSRSSFSFGITGEMDFANKKNFKKALKKRKDKAGLKLLKKVGIFKGYSLMNFIEEYNKEKE